MPAPFSSTSDQTTPDDSMPPDAVGAEASDLGSAPDLTLTPEQAAAAGLAGALPGDTFSVRITGTIASADNGIEADIVEVSEGRIENGELGEPAPEAEAEAEPMGPPPGVQSPAQAGFGKFGK